VDASRVLLLRMTVHTSLRVAELGALLIAIGGVAIAFSAVMPMGRKPGNLIGGLALAAGGVLLIVAIHFGSFGWLA
jgi:hypothetical protein